MVDSWDGDNDGDADCSSNDDDGENSRRIKNRHNAILRDIVEDENSFSSLYT